MLCFKKFISCVAGLFFQKFRSMCRWYPRRNPCQIGGRIGQRRLVVEIGELPLVTFAHILALALSHSNTLSVPMLFLGPLPLEWIHHKWNPIRWSPRREEEIQPGSIGAREVDFRRILSRYAEQVKSPFTYWYCTGTESLKDPLWCRFYVMGTKNWTFIYTSVSVKEALQ